MRRKGVKKLIKPATIYVNYQKYGKWLRIKWAMRCVVLVVKNFRRDKNVHHYPRCTNSQCEGGRTLHLSTLSHRIESINSINSIAVV